MTRTVVAGVVALVVALAATPLAMRVAVRAGVVDRPGPLKPQDRAIPYLGGVAVFAATVAGVALGRPAVLVPCAAAVALGVADDRFDLAPLFRLLGQLTIGLLVAATVATSLPADVAWPALVVVAVLLVNGVNFLDGLDMLAAGVVAVAAAAFAALLTGAGRDLAVALAAALVGFLAYNRPPARIYLGDGGSYLLGTALTVLVADAWQHGSERAMGIAALVVVAPAVAEVAFAVVRRRRGGGSLLSGDRRHPYDLLVRRGWPRPAASLTYVAVETILAALALAAAASHRIAVALGVAVAVAVALVVSGGLGGALSPEPDGGR